MQCYSAKKGKKKERKEGRKEGRKRERNGGRKEGRKKVGIDCGSRAVGWAKEDKWGKIKTSVIE